MSERKILPSLLHQIFNPDSRKVGFGWWVFIVATVALFKDKIDVSHWSESTWIAMGLIGGGTVADKVLGGGLANVASAVTGIKQAVGGSATAPAPANPAAPEQPK